MKKINKEKLSKLEGGRICFAVGFFGPLFYLGGVGMQAVVGGLASYCWNS
jgi:hypothetical protein